MSKTARYVVIGIVTLFIAGVLAWQLRPVSHRVHTVQTHQFDLQVSYDKFRQIMVRKNATKAIVSHGGMKIISEGVEDLKLDLSADDRPLLNAIRGKSKAAVDATKMLTVEINNEQVDTEQLTLRSRAQVNADRLHVESKAVGQQGQIKDYVTIISASPKEDATHIELSLEMEIEIRVPSVFTGRADSEVAKAAIESLAQQQEAITAFVIEHASERIVLPELN
ncbi:hypothetical protein [Planctomycetes bacterium K23_9]|uniref:Uncharacterized protein n=1 Tax=Stieleria marina TaxID=1930275 RepID=A0A517NQ43_9BACT|nr:hypothetical protein K239x_11820 [Planctomycetes bacterium K23_9]